MNLQEVEYTFKGKNLDMLVYKAYYRTKMCLYKDKCNYGDMCYNAHSKNELRIPMCMYYYKYNTCSLSKCERAHDIKLPELPVILYANLRSKVGERQGEKDEKEDSINLIREKARERERKLEKEIDDLKYNLKKRRRVEDDAEMYQELSEKEINNLKEDNANLTMQIHSYVSKIQTLEQQVQLYQHFFQNYLQGQLQVQANTNANVQTNANANVQSIQNQQIPTLRPINNQADNQLRLPEAPRFEISRNSFQNHIDYNRDPRLQPR